VVVVGDVARAVGRISPDAIAVFELVAERGEITSKELASVRAITHGTAQEAVAELVRAGLVRIARGGHGESVIRLGSRAALQGLLESTPSPPAAAVKLIRARQSLDHILGAEAERGPGIERITDLNTLRARIGAIGEATRRELLSLHAGTPPGVEMLEASLPADLEVLARGVTMRTAVPKSFAELPHVRDYATTLGERGAEIRFADALPHRLLVADGTTAVVPLDASHLDRGAMVVTEPLLTASLRHLATRILRSGLRLDELERVHVDQGPSPVDRRVLLLMSSGVTDEVAARQMSITDRQFRRYVASVLARLGATSRFQAGVKAVERGWI
jgi:DNA-binding CsgD family transcriptional regulator